jgi:hypothetical protein
MGLYLGHSPTHAANISLILNPQTGHVSPQFHLIYDDDFVTVSFLRTATVPPHWAELVHASSTLHVYTERQVDTWQSFPELLPKNGDFTSDQAEISNVGLGSRTHDAISSADSEGVASDFVPNSQSVLQAVSFQDQNVSQNDHPQPSLWQMPESVNLDKSGLRCLSQLVELNRHETIAILATTSEPIISH